MVITSLILSAVLVVLFIYLASFALPPLFSWVIDVAIVIMDIVSDYFSDEKGD